MKKFEIGKTYRKIDEVCNYTYISEITIENIDKGIMTGIRHYYSIVNNEVYEGGKHKFITRIQKHYVKITK